LAKVTNFPPASTRKLVRLCEWQFQNDLIAIFYARRQEIFRFHLIGHGRNPFAGIIARNATPAEAGADRGAAP
jgi:hypothetical protein